MTGRFERLAPLRDCATCVNFESARSQAAPLPKRASGPGRPGSYPRDVTAKPGASRGRRNPLRLGRACPGHPRRHARGQRRRMKILPSVQDLERAARSTTWISGTSPGMTDMATLRPPTWQLRTPLLQNARALHHLAPKALKRLIRRFELAAKLWRDAAPAWRSPFGSNRQAAPVCATPKEAAWQSPRDRNVCLPL
jgi:hypothetical protein